jgi:hypothetical protein
MFSAAFTSESACEGVTLKFLTEQERTVPVKDIEGYLAIWFSGPQQWRYEFNHNGHFAETTVNDQWEVAREVCRIAKGKGGTL